MAGFQTRIADARQIAAWLRLAVTNVELVVTWLILWPAAHIGLLLIAHFVLRLEKLSPGTLIGVEVFPAFMLALAVLRMTTSTSMLVKVARAVSIARQSGTPAPAWAERPGALLRLATPSDWDVAVGIGLVALLEALVR